MSLTKGTLYAVPTPKLKDGRLAEESTPKDITASEIKDSKYAIGKNPENLTPNQQAKLELIANINVNIKMYKSSKIIMYIFPNFQFLYDPSIYKIFRIS